MAELFIVGVGRSGTSLLQSMFAAHPAVAMLPETSFFRRYVSASRTTHGGQRSEIRPLYDTDDRIRRLDRKTWEQAVNLSLSVRPATREQAYSPDRRPHGFPATEVGAIYQFLLSPEIAAAQAKRDPQAIAYTGDKDPRLTEYLPLIKDLFPESHVIQIVRDPRDVLLSKSKADWSKGRGWRGNLAAGRFQLDLSDRYGRWLWGWRYHVVRYEDLLDFPERTLRRLTEELDLDFDGRMLEFGRAAEQMTLGKPERWKKETLGPLLRNNAGKWQQELPLRQVHLVELVYRHWMERYGYVPLKSNGSAPGRRHPLAGFVMRVLYGTASRLYGRYRDWNLRQLAKRLNV